MVNNCKKENFLSLSSWVFCPYISNVISNKRIGAQLFKAVFLTKCNLRLICNLRLKKVQGERLSKKNDI